jgi:hypothetical protein
MATRKMKRKGEQLVSADADRVAGYMLSASDYSLFQGLSGDDRHDVVANALQRGGDSQAWRVAMDWVLKRPASPR